MDVGALVRQSTTPPLIFLCCHYLVIENNTGSSEFLASAKINIIPSLAWENELLMNICHDSFLEEN